MLRRMTWIILMAVIGTAVVVLYRGSFLYYQAKERTSNVERKIALLESEQKSFHVNDLLYHELGKAYFDAGVNRLQDTAMRNADFQNSYRNFIRSLTLNPLSANAHFDFAQALQYMNFLNLPFQENYFDEYKKAALLSGQNIKIYSEVGRVLFSRWSTLSPQEKQLALDIVRFVLFKKEPEKVNVFLNIWDLNIKDYGVLEKIFPQDAAVDRQVGQFLGEKTLSQDERLRFLSQAETLEFRKAKEEYRLGLTDFNALKIGEAKIHFQTALASLQNIVFYQNLTSKNSIDTLEYNNLLKSVHLGLAKCILEETRKLDEAISHLYAYLDLEDEPSFVGEVEAFLRERGLIEEKSGMNFRDFSRFALELFLGFKQNRYREIVQAGQSLERSLLVIPEGTKQDYARILELVGDSYQKLDYLYESNNFYQKAVDMGRQDVLLFLKMRKNFERLNDAEKLAQVDKSVEALLEFKETQFQGLLLKKGEPFAQKIILNGSKFLLSYGFEEKLSEPFPLISIMFNGQMIWDDYLRSPELRLALPSNIGDNSVKITTVNRPVMLLSMKVSAEKKPNVSKNEDISSNNK